MGLDLYLWLVYRTFPLRAPLRLYLADALPAVRGRIRREASDRVTVDNFRRKDCLRELKKIKLAWPEPELRHGSGRLDPACPRHLTIAPLNQGQLTS